MKQRDNRMAAVTGIMANKGVWTHAYRLRILLIIVTPLATRLRIISRCRLNACRHICLIATYSARLLHTPLLIALSALSAMRAVARRSSSRARGGVQADDRIIIDATGVARHGEA